MNPQTPPLSTSPHTRTYTHTQRNVHMDRVLGLELIERDESGNITAVITEAPTAALTVIVSSTAPVRPVPFGGRHFSFFFTFSFILFLSFMTGGGAMARALIVCRDRRIRSQLSREFSMFFSQQGFQRVWRRTMLGLFFPPVFLIYNLRLWLCGLLRPPLMRHAGLNSFRWGGLLPLGAILPRHVL